MKENYKSEGLTVERMYVEPFGITTIARKNLRA